MRKIKNILWGVAIIALGVIAGLNSFGGADIDIFFDGWWTLFIIVPSFFGLFEKGGRFANLLFLAVGVILLLESQGIIAWDTITKMILPVVLIIVGLSIVFKGIFKENNNQKIKELLSSDNQKVSRQTALFSGSEVNFSGQPFFGGCYTAVFGGIEVDLSTAVIEKDVLIETTAIFGGVDIKLPSDVNCKISSTSIFGGVSDERKKPTAEGRPTVYVNGTAVFGGVDVV